MTVGTTVQSRGDILSLLLTFQSDSWAQGDASGLDRFSGIPLRGRAYHERLVVEVNG